MNTPSPSPLNAMDGERAENEGKQPTLKTHSEENFSMTRKAHRSDTRNRQRADTPNNPLQRGIKEYLTKHLTAEFYSTHNLDGRSLTSALPKRYDLYPPLLLLPSNAFSVNPQWQAFVAKLDESRLQALYACIAASFSGKGVTHIAINAPITRITAAGEENTLRSPTGLVPLYGDFGPVTSRDAANPDPQREHLQNSPTEADFRDALWVRAVQNAGIVQTWAPMYTMFSRGNIMEKARILGLGKEKFRGLDERELNQPTNDIAVVDMFAGVGYFVFSYLKRGVGRVWAWDINPWSIEGLRRGCEENGWGIKVVRADSEGMIEGGLEAFANSLQENHRVVAFVGDNVVAAGIMRQLKVELKKRNAWKPVRHVNLGLLPTSRQSWDGAAKVLDPSAPGWIHVHENSDVTKNEAMKGNISSEFGSLLRFARGISQNEAPSELTTCVHVEKVKTFAPGVMHCVFDLQICPTPALEIQN